MIILPNYITLDEFESKFEVIRVLEQWSETYLRPLRVLYLDISGNIIELLLRSAIGDDYKPYYRELDYLIQSENFDDNLGFKYVWTQ